MQDSQIATMAGAGIVGKKKLSDKDLWIIGPKQKERATAAQNIYQQMPMHNREIVERYIKKISSTPREP